MSYSAPFPYFGGKSTIADYVWTRLGADVKNYVEPFAGSAAMLLKRPDWTPDAGYIETINDADGMVANFWRAVKSAPDEVAFHADWPVNENDLHARHIWLVGQKESLASKLEGDPEFFDAKIAGWWCWGACCWIGSGWCSGNGPWTSVDGEMVNTAGRGVKRKRVHLGNAGRGVNRQRVHLGDAGQGDPGTGANGLYAWMDALCERLARVRVACGDWSRVCGSTPTVKMGTTAVFLDPPYSDLARRVDDLYSVDSLDVAHDVRRWCIENGDDPRLRIALCGYGTEHTLPGWHAWSWKAQGGYGLQGNGTGRANSAREVVWFSPHCIQDVDERQMAMSFA